MAATYPQAGETGRIAGNLSREARRDGLDVLRSLYRKNIKVLIDMVAVW